MESRHISLSVDWLAGSASFVASIVPIYEVYNIEIRKHAELDTAVYYGLMWLQYVGWAIYGSLIPEESHHWAVYSSNAFGCLACLFYCHRILLALSIDNRRYIMYIYMICIMIGGGLVVTAYIGHITNVERASNIFWALGYVAATLTITWNLSAALVIPRTVRRNAESVLIDYQQQSICCMYNLSSALWCYYGVVIDDFFVTGTNLLGGLIQFITLILIVFSVTTVTKKETCDGDYFYETIPSESQKVEEKRESTLLHDVETGDGQTVVMTAPGSPLPARVATFAQWGIELKPALSPILGKAGYKEG
jgi:hypothetical protein